jgi:magnesium-transporting ATPase (P-type)
VGNFVDIEMFRATGATLSSTGESDSTTIHPSGHGERNMQIVKRYEFVHSNAYMTVLVRDTNDQRLYFYLKGS